MTLLPSLIPHPAPVCPALPQPPLLPASGSTLFGTLIVEAVVPGSDDLELNAPGWELRTWPVARLGDVTLEARPLDPNLGPAELRRALEAIGVTALGPIRERRRT
ncbi:hypothetical protein [Deinococcus koreensis]|uniref:Uncharacterized protein n=1 Tax=Deinococcus koreensis TaxID=2054903 RepID=A0A2K3UVN6_9DEIO|nr:hypothetical protein [Deinococcus koreensis]PNY80592.1 hypothetical protein CVO96_03735 [Deinococcus koreensis]